jgi:hypothetical protein
MNPADGEATKIEPRVDGLAGTWRVYVFNLRRKKICIVLASKTCSV